MRSKSRERGERLVTLTGSIVHAMQLIKATKGMKLVDSTELASDSDSVDTSVIPYAYIRPSRF